MYSAASATKEALKNEPPKNVQRTLTHALDALDCYGVPGAVAVCLMEDGASYIKASGMCMDLNGAAMALYAAVDAFREIADQRGQKEAEKALAEAAKSLMEVIRATRNGKTN